MLRVYGRWHWALATGAPCAVALGLNCSPPASSQCDKVVSGGGVGGATGGGGVGGGGESGEPGVVPAECVRVTPLSEPPFL